MNPPAGPRIQTIESLDHPSLEPYRTMRRPLAHAEQGIFVAEGEKVVRRLLEHPHFEVVSLLIPPRWLETYGHLVRARGEPIDVFVAEKRVLQDLVGFSMYQGILAVGRIPHSTSLEDILSRSQHPTLLVAADALANAANMGALVRDCCAFGVDGLIIGETCSTPWLRRSIRSSMGTIFDLPIAETRSLVDDLTTLRQQGVNVVAAHPGAEGRTIAQAQMAGDTCVVVGSEGLGISEEVLAVCDERVAIPMSLGVDSLNVVSATAVFLYEARRQRGCM